MPIMKYLREDIVIHDQLNSKFWKANGELKPEVRKKLMAIVIEFEKFIDTDIDIIDIQICGSNASYNYTDDSDLDVHIITSYEMPGVDTNEAKNLLQRVCTLETKRFNDKYDIMVYGAEVQLYVQDVRSAIISNGIYSVCENRWVKEPKMITSAKHADLSEEEAKWKAKVQDIIKKRDADAAKDALNKLHLMRHNSLAADGEFGKGNQLFKDLRAAGVTADLKECIANGVSKKLSLESMYKGQIVNRL